ncbi:MAG: Gmad2 immunoglobulin-like domain-containing protein [Candidatus Paceibacterota bacterium]
MKKILYIVILIIIALLLVYVFKTPKKQVTSFTECVSAGNPVMESYPRQCRDGEKLFVEEIEVFQYKDLLKVASPASGARVSSPLIIEGEARGYWFFEASFPVRLLDEDGNELAVGIAQAKSNWMVENYVPFEVKIEFSNPDSDIGYLVFEKDNPSGLPENADSVSMPIFFQNQ